MGRFLQHNFKIPLYPPLAKGDKDTRKPRDYSARDYWIPAFAGMTIIRVFRLFTNVSLFADAKLVKDAIKNLFGGCFSHHLSQGIKSRSDFEGNELE